MYSIITEQKLISVVYKNHKQERLLSEGRERRETTAPGAWQHTWFESHRGVGVVKTEIFPRHLFLPESVTLLIQKTVRASVVTENQQ